MPNSSNATVIGSGAQIAPSVIESSDIKNDELIDEDIKTTAAIAWSKISKVGSSIADFATKAITDLTGILLVAHGGTGKDTLGAHKVLVGNDANAITEISPSTAGKVLTSNGVGADPSFQSPSTAYGLLAGVSLGSAAATLASGTIAAKKFLRVIIYIPSLASADTPILRFNGDSGANYASRISSDFGAPTNGGNTEITLRLSATTEGTYYIIDIFNVATIKKWLLSAGSAEAVGKNMVGSWNNTSDQITSITLLTLGGQNLNAGTQMTVLGMD